MMNETITAGPAIVAAWMPASEKMPPPTMTPIARTMSSPVPNTAGSRWRALLIRSIASSGGRRRALPIGTSATRLPPLHRATVG